MRFGSDEEYFRSRADEERELARSAVSPAVSRIHLSLAVGYDELVRREQQSGQLVIGSRIGSAARA